MTPATSSRARPVVVLREVVDDDLFEIVGHDRGFANARGAEIDEVVLTLAH